MSYSSSSSSTSCARQPRLSSTSTTASLTSASRTGGGDSAYTQDFNAVQEAVKSLQQRDAEIRKETVLLSTVQLVSLSRRKVSEALQAAKTTADEARRQLDVLAALATTGLTQDEHNMRRLQQKKLTENLMHASTSLEASWRTFEDAAAKREQQLQAQGATPAREVLLANGDGPAAIDGLRYGAGLELPRRQEADPMSRQLQMQQQLEEAEIETHAAVVDEYAEEVTSLQRNIQGLQRTMVDMAEHTQAQGEIIDNIEHNMSQVSVQTGGATEQLVQASMTHRRSIRLLYCLLALAALLAAGVIYAAVKKSQEGR